MRNGLDRKSGKSPNREKLRKQPGVIEHHRAGEATVFVPKIVVEPGVSVLKLLGREDEEEESAKPKSR